jgi:uncharacterized protein (DUF362 family)
MDWGIPQVLLQCCFGIKGSKVSDVLVKRVFDYDNYELLVSFVDVALQRTPAVRRVLHNEDPERLIVLKPNWVQESHEFQRDVWIPVITHPVLIEAVLDSIARNIKGKATVVICDAPHAYAAFDCILKRGDLIQRLNVHRRKSAALNIEVLDLRREITIRGKEEVILKIVRNKEDPRGYVAVNLGTHSLFHNAKGEGRYYGAMTDTATVNMHHRGERQEYLLAGTPMHCDLFINLPKLKTHKKTGITCSLKNLVGINGDKNWLPHHTEGSPENGGDEFPKLAWSSSFESRVKKLIQQWVLRFPHLLGTPYSWVRKSGKAILGGSDRIIRNGNWEGNDTCWRMALDLNRALLYGGPDGSLQHGGPCRAYLSIVDGLIGGEGNGPLCPDPVTSGFVVAGADPASVDLVAAQLIGFNFEKLPIVKQAFAPHSLPITEKSPESVTVFDLDAQKECFALSLEPFCCFKPHFGWPTLSSIEPA